MTKISKTPKKPATNKAAGKLASKHPAQIADKPKAGKTVATGRPSRALGLAPVGRPTIYQAGYCDQIVTLMRDGLSVEGVADNFGVTKETLYDWMRTYPEFSDAHKKGKAACAAWWEKKLRASESPASIMFALRNLAPETWKDKSEVELSGNADKPIYVMMTAVDGKL